MIKSSQLKVKEVININDGRRLGAVYDLEVDLDSGRVTAIIVPGRRYLLSWFGREHDIVIPWAQIQKIGADVILVDVAGGEISG